MLLLSCPSQVVATAGSLPKDMAVSYSRFGPLDCHYVHVPLVCDHLNRALVHFDLQTALKLGTLTVADLRKWQQIRSIPIVGLLAAAFQGFRERMMGNPRFLLAVAAEEIIGGNSQDGCRDRGQGREVQPGVGGEAGHHVAADDHTLN